jgi:hypothetical protein
MRHSMRLQAKNTTHEDRVHVELSFKGRIVYVKSDSVVHFIKECISSVIYLEAGFKRPSCPQMSSSHCTYIHEAQSRATEVGSSIGHRKLETVRNKLLFIRPHRLGAAAAMIVACETKRGHPRETMRRSGQCRCRHGGIGEW